MRVLVTGGAGFIGSHIVDALLDRGHEPFVVDNLETGSRDNLPEQVPLFEVDIRDAAGLEKAFAEAAPEAVCHQAAQMSVSRSVREPAYDADVNIMGLLYVCDLSVRTGVKRMVFASSGGVLYGDVYEPATEEHPSNPVSPYGLSKWAGEKYLDFYAREYGLQGVALRYSNVYGPRQNPHGEAGVVAIFCRTMLTGGQATVNGDGKYVRDYVYVGDVARANLLALEADRLSDFVALNAGTGVGADVNELAARLREFCGERRRSDGISVEIPPPAHGPARPGDLRSNLLSAARAKELLSWEPTVSLGEGLRTTVTWFAEHGRRG